MHIYLAAAFSRQEEMRKHATALRDFGHTITSRWLEQDPVEDAKPSQSQAEADYRDIEAADTMISFTHPPQAGPSRGGRHVEFGIGLEMGLRMIVVGHLENLFHYLPEVEFYPHWDGLRERLLQEHREGETNGS